MLGDYLPAKLGMDEGEIPVCMVVTTDYQGDLLFAFENGKVARVPLSAYATKTRRRKLARAYSDKSRLVQVLYLIGEQELLFTSTDTRMLLVHSGLIPAKVTKDSQGVAVMALKKKQLLGLGTALPGQLRRPQALHGTHPAWRRCPAQGRRCHRAADPGIAGAEKRAGDIALRL